MTFGTRLAAIAAVLVAALAPTPGWAAETGKVASTVPVAGAVLPGAPPVVTMQMAGVMDRVSATVTDGCGRPVPNTAEVYGKRVAIRLAVSHVAMQNHGNHTTAGGGWRIAWRAVDPQGRTTSGNLPFTVNVKADCAVPTVAAPAAQPPAEHPEFLWILYTIAGLGVLLTFARVLARRKTA